MILTISRDGGSTWSTPQIIAPPGSGQFHAQIVVDPSDHQTVYASWLQDWKKSVVRVAKSTDFGASWTTVIANQTQAGVDKDVLVVNGRDVYVAYYHSQTAWVSSSHDGGRTFTSAKIDTNGQFGVSLAGGGAIDDVGNAHFSWVGYKRDGQGKGPVNIYVTRSTDGGATWTPTALDLSGAPPDCSSYLCGRDYLGPSSAMASDATGQLYVVWNAGTVDQGPERIWLSTSSDRGQTWSTKAQVSLAPTGVDHAFPTIVAGASRDVRVAWMDQRQTPHWNVYYRTSADGGTTWSSETTLSTYVSGYSYVFTDGFRFPFGDYFGMAIDGAGRTHLSWGEGYNYNSPGSIWYTRQN